MNFQEVLEAITELLKKGSDIDLEGIKNKLSLPQEAISGVIDFMCEKNFVSKAADGTISLTDNGREAIEDINMLKDYALNFAEKKDDIEVSDVLNMENFAKIKNFIDGKN